MEQKPLTVTTPTASYDIHVGANILQRLPTYLGQLGLEGQLWLVSDSAVYPHYGAALEHTLREAGYRVQSFTVPSGETSKDLATTAQLYDWMINGNVERQDTVLALGGGVVGDLAGFAAATVLRGIALIQLPTTLLAMVDSAIGGKTGVNHALGKNLIGAFHQPRLVLSDVTTLGTLAPRELCAGWAEVIKHGVIRDADLFARLEAQATAMTSITDVADVTQLASLGKLIRQAAAVKVQIVNADERESGERMLLNYGHTLGHALEAAASYGTLLHGEAVAVGMHLAAQISQRLGMCDTTLVERQQHLLHAYGLSTVMPSGIDPIHLLTLTSRDKKVRSGKVRWIMPTAIGHATVRTDIPEAVVQTVLEDAIHTML
ncbi:MAG: 3-dehydroquinate synthase [Chloroflexi bacterium AL-W]|nr:3-dehydroquinate synthase [Chloroflexi bacterium AL-N1]NOK67086.1 3-dehydroquinate synthase [Chloroflexi bacterium AL-N10]NOK74621.1 3-dehydroquinate synthase [Chloroflexi bacterium AL-N5]NOK81688.1 3-dehydroquinate synthase [Chloroflexi bacterium AL-W]NOK89158.1 3-dehydroquinate synthase [Chloroflexi bacterium AL-N15]